MEKSLNKFTTINTIFYVGLAIKAINALIEFISGVLLIVFSHNLINHIIQLIALPELREDPKDIAMNYFITIGQNLSISSQHSAAVYMLLHGTTKLAVIWLLIKKKLWAYPVAAGLFSLFIAYEIYSLFYSPSVFLILFTIIDAAMVIMIILEYKGLKEEKTK